MDVYEKLFETDSCDFLIINHQGMPYYMWSNFCVMCCIVSSFIYAQIAAFHKNTDENLKYHLRYCFEILFLIDMIVQFFTDYPSSNKTAK